MSGSYDCGMYGSASDDSETLLHSPAPSYDSTSQMPAAQLNSHLIVTRCKRQIDLWQWMFGPLYTNSLYV